MPDQFLYDTSPLITLAVARLDKGTVLEHFLAFISITLSETVAQEATANEAYSDAVLVKTLLNSGAIRHIPIPKTPIDELLDAYSKVDDGERDTIRLGTMLPDCRVVIDDQHAFFVAARFDVRPIMLLDVLVMYAQTGGLSKRLAQNSLDAISKTGRYSSAAIQHTIYKLNRITDDPDHN